MKNYLLGMGLVVLTMLTGCATTIQSKNPTVTSFQKDSGYNLVFALRGLSSIGEDEPFKETNGFYRDLLADKIDLSLATNEKALVEVNQPGDGNSFGYMKKPAADEISQGAFLTGLLVLSAKHPSYSHSSLSSSKIMEGFFALIALYTKSGYSINLDSLSWVKEGMEKYGTGKFEEYVNKTFLVDAQGIFLK